MTTLDGEKITIPSLLLVSGPGCQSKVEQLQLALKHSTNPHFCITLPAKTSISLEEEQALQSGGTLESLLGRSLNETERESYREARQAPSLRLLEFAAILDSMKEYAEEGVLAVLFFCDTDLPTHGPTGYKARLVDAICALASPQTPIVVGCEDELLLSCFRKSIQKGNIDPAEVGYMTIPIEDT